MTINNLNDTINISFKFYYKPSNKSWKIEKTHLALEQFLSIIINVIPKEKIIFPKIVINPSTKSNRYLDEYKNKLEVTLSEMFQRSDFFNLELVRNFFEFENFQIHNEEKYRNNLTAQITNLPKEIFYMCYNKEFNLLFCACGKKVETSSLFNFYNENGEIQIYKIVNSSYGEKKFVKIFEQNLIYIPHKIYFNPKNKQLVISFSNGEIKIYSIHNVETPPTALFLISTLKNTHHSAVINFYINFDNGYLYSLASKEKFLSISESNYEKRIASIEISGKILTSFEVYSLLPFKCIIGDDEGSLWLCEIINNQSGSIIQGIHTKMESITSICIPEYDSLFFFANSKNYISMYEIEANPNFTTIKEKITINALYPLSTPIIYDKAKKEILFGLVNGTIQIWSHSIKEPEVVIRAHREKVNAIFSCDNEILLSSGDDNSIRAWSKPEKYFSEICRVNKMINDEYIVQNEIEGFNSISALQKAFAIMKDEDEGEKEPLTPVNEKNEEEEDDGERSLDGWDEVPPFVLNSTSNPKVIPPRSASFSGGQIVKNLKEQYSYFKSVFIGK